MIIVKIPRSDLVLITTVEGIQNQIDNEGTVYLGTNIKDMYEEVPAVSLLSTPFGEVVGMMELHLLYYERT